MNPVPDVQKEKNMPNAMLLLFKIPIGTSASSPFLLCTVMNAPMSTPNRMKSTMMRAFFHEYSLPPHSSARIKHRMEARKRVKAGRSSLSIFCFHVVAVVVGAFSLSMKTMMAKVGADMIGLI